MPKTRAQLLNDLATIVADYREGEIERRKPEIIEAWLQQFPRSSQDALLRALSHVFRKTYISREAFRGFLSGLASSSKLSPGTKPAEYWKKANFLNIQRGGNSQRELLTVFDEVLRETHGFRLSKTGSTDGDFIYLDDCVGTGSRVRADLCIWIESAAPKRVTLHVITPVLYLGSWWIDSKIQETAKESGKSVTLHKWRLDQFELENRFARRNRSDVLWPTAIPNDPDTQAYVRQLERVGHPPALRTPGNTGASGLFAHDDQKILLEQLFLQRGCQIRRECRNLPDKARPLGYHNLDCLGFGSMFVTYRNCPNNCPLALWVQQAEYPALLPRKTNTQAADENWLWQME